MNWLRYAVLSKQAYGDKIDIAGYTSHFISMGSTQVHVLISDEETLVVFRGTEKNLEDILVDLNIKKEDGTHKGFNQAYLSVHAELKKLVDKDKPAKFIGHSLGGALAIKAGTFHIGSDKQIITFGAPRVFTKKYAKFYESCEITHRFENKCDPVPYLPPYSFGFRHVGKTLYLADKSLKMDPWSFGPFLAMYSASLQTKAKAHSIDSYIDKLRAFSYN